MMRASVMDSGTALSIRNVTKAFGAGRNGSMLSRLQWRTGRESGKPSGKSKRVIAINDISLEVHRNEIFGILGPNGSGKSTLIRLTATLLVPDEGEIQVFGLDVSRDEMQVKRLINRVSVDAAFFKNSRALRT